MRKATMLILLIVSLSGVLKAQETVQRVLEDWVESLDTESENIDLQEIMEDLTYLSQHPLPVNIATREDLQRLHFLSDLQVDDLLAYRKRTGQIYTIYEMAAIDGFSIELLQKLEPFLSFKIYESAAAYKRSDNDLIARSTRAFSNPKSGTAAYVGSPERYYLRYKHISNHLEFGLVGEKDPGEAFFKGSNKQGFDYLGVYGNVTIGASHQKLFIGDYRVRFGQGLVASQGFSLGKSSEATQVFRFGQGIRSSSSTDENQFFRGIASQLKAGKFTFMPFVSFRRLDAHLDTIEGKATFGAFQNSGYHRTPSEIAGKNTVEQIAGGANAGFTYKRWSVGFTAVYTKFNVPLKRSEDLSNYYLWEGKESRVAGMDWKGAIKNVFIFGEVAACADKGKALLTGLLFKPAANGEVTVLYRNINKTYFSFFSNAFTESSRTNDEKGFYLGFKYLPLSSLTFRGYADIFEYQWIKYTTAAPSNGFELFAQLTYSPSKRTELYLRFFQEEKEVKVVSDNFKFNQTQKINRYRLNFSRQVNSSLSLKSRIEGSFYTKLTDEIGMLVYQDIIYKPAARRSSLNGRLAWFKTDGYNSRFYAYENDLLYTFSIPSLYGKGIRTYLNFRQNFSEHVSLWIKAASQHPLSSSETGKTDDQNTKYELKVQLRYQF